MANNKLTVFHHPVSTCKVCRRMHLVLCNPCSLSEDCGQNAQHLSEPFKHRSVSVWVACGFQAGVSGIIFLVDLFDSIICHLALLRLHRGHVFAIDVRIKYLGSHPSYVVPGIPSFLHEDCHHVDALNICHLLVWVYTFLQALPFHFTIEPDHGRLLEVLHVRWILDL